MKLSPHYDGPSILAIDGDAAGQQVPLTRQRRRLESRLADLTDDEWCTRSRCDGWTVQDVVCHLVTVNRFWASSVTAGIAGTPTRVLAAFDPAAHPPMLVEPMKTLAPREVLDQLVASNHGLLDVVAGLDEEGWSTTAETPAGHVSIRLLAMHALWDAWVHERDIAIPLGLTLVDEPDEVGSCLRYAAALGPALTVGEERDRETFAVEATDPATRFTIEVGEMVRVRDTSANPGVACLRGDAADLVEALSLRAPLPTDAPDGWHRLVAGLATVFDDPRGSPRETPARS